MKRLIDVTEQTIRRFLKKLKNAKKTYAGKKKHHISKVEIVMTATSHTHPVRSTILEFERKNPLHRDAEKYVRLSKATFVIFPFRRKKNQPLTVKQKNHNRQTSFRMKVEHKVRELNVFKILSKTYHNFSKNSTYP